MNKKIVKMCECCYENYENELCSNCPYDNTESCNKFIEEYSITPRRLYEIARFYTDKQIEFALRLRKEEEYD